MHISEGHHQVFLESNEIKAKIKISKQSELNQTIIIGFRYEAIEICIYAT